jgi:hypothetical protein
MPVLGMCGWKWLSVIGALVREKAMPAEVGMKTVSRVQEFGVQGPYCL